MGRLLTLGAGGAGIAPAFSPLSVGNLSVWYDANKGVTLNGLTVSGWADQSGNNRNMTQSVAVRQPDFKALGINGRPSIYFPNTGSKLAYLELPSELAGFTNLTFFVVVKISAFGLSQNYNSILSGNTGGNFMLQQVGQNSSVGGRSMSTPTTGGVYYIRAGVQDTVSTDFFSNNVLLGNQTTGGYATGIRYIVNASSNGGYNANCEIAEVLIYNAKLNSTQRTDVSTYLNSKYAIY